MNTTPIVEELLQSFERRTQIAPPFSARDPQFDMTAAYAVQRDLATRRVEEGHRIVGRKVGYANKAVWRTLKIDTLVWAPMFDDTVTPASSHEPLSVRRLWAPKIEPEIVLRLGRPVAHGASDPTAVLDAVEAIALGFEIVDSVFADWKFHPTDFVAGYGLHVALVVGEWRSMAGADLAAVTEQLAQFRVRLSKNGVLAAEGGGRNVLKSPVLCLGELASAVARQTGEAPLHDGDIISTGSLTDAQFIGRGETWTATVEGVDLPELTLETV